MNDPARHPIWALIREARRTAGISQRELARRAATSQSAIARYERAEVMPDIGTVFRLVRACGLDLKLELVPHDDHDEALIERHLKLSPLERSTATQNFTRFAAEAAKARRAAR